MAPDPQRALSQGSPALAALMLALGTSVIGRALVGRTVLTRALRR
jgi:hypothetical protein